MTRTALPARKRGLRILTALFALSYGSALVYAVFFSKRRRHMDVRYLFLKPFRNTIEDFHNLHDVGVFNYFSNIFGNVFLFLPVPFILAILFKITRFSLVLLTGFLLSFSIELLQYCFDVGVADIDDLILNTLGTFLGYWCYMAAKNWLPGTAV